MEPVNVTEPADETESEDVVELIDSADSMEGHARAHKKQRFHPGSNLLAFCLMPFVCLGAFSLPGFRGAMISRLCLFAPNAFFILCGFHLARREKNEPGIYGRTLKRTLRRFLLLSLMLLAGNAAIFGQLGSPGAVIPALLTKRTLFNFFVLCIWPFQFGEPMWFLHSLLYARVLLWGMNRYGLMRHYKPIMFACMLLMLLCGEFSGLIHFRFLGYSHIPANAITRALPYMLLGRWMYQKNLFRIHRSVCIPGFVVGMAAAYIELMFLIQSGYLNYSGHMIGYGLMAFFACCFFLRSRHIKKNIITRFGRSFSWDIYAASSPVALLLIAVTEFLPARAARLAQSYIAVPVYLVCLGFAFAVESFKSRRRQSGGKRAPQQ